MHILYLNFSEQEKYSVFVGCDNKLICTRSKKKTRKEAQQVLEMIDNVLFKSGVLLSDIKAIVSIQGAGSYTSLRIGATTANTLAYVLCIPALSINVNEFGNEMNTAVEQSDIVQKSYDKFKNLNCKNKYIIPEYSGQANVTFSDNL